ncbi:MAG: HD domain-containing protein, partial [Candidatus Aenigmatarchaeota archaeon]
ILKMALIHDFCEVYTGDITPSDKINQKKKARMEEEAIIKIFSGIEKGKDYVELWKELQDETSEEARIVKQVDCLEMVLQASIYEHQGYKNLQEFFDYCDKKITNPVIKNLLKEVIKIRG